MTLELIKIDYLQIKVLNYTNACKWIQKMTAYLKDKDFWISIETVLEEWWEQKSNKISESAETIKVSEKADDSTTERNILMHQILTKKWLKKSEKKN